MPVVPHPSPTLYERATEFAGVESTARSAWEHGYDLVLCEDLCADLSAESHASSFKNIFPRLAHIVQSPEITLA
jgi:nicotinamidase-related amidase